MRTTRPFISEIIQPHSTVRKKRQPKIQGCFLFKDGSGDRAPRTHRLKANSSKRFRMNCLKSDAGPIARKSIDARAVGGCPAFNEVEYLNFLFLCVTIAPRSGLLLWSDRAALIRSRVGACGRERKEPPKGPFQPVSQSKEEYPVTHTGKIPEWLLNQARSGDASALGQLLEHYRNYLRLMARELIGGPLRLKLDPSDLVQETFLEAYRDFPRFAGGGEPELVAWLRRILVRNLANQAEHHQAQRRDHRRQESLEAMLDRSSIALQTALAAPVSSPSAQEHRREQAVLLADALEKLPSDYREVFILRNLEHLPFDQIAARMGRSSGAVRMLWGRALERLSTLLKEKP